MFLTDFHTQKYTGGIISWVGIFLTVTLATPYQQAVQPPSKPMGLGVTFDSSTNKHVAAGRQDVDGHGRQRTRG